MRLSLGNNEPVDQPNHQTSPSRRALSVRGPRTRNYRQMNGDSNSLRPSSTTSSSNKSHQHPASSGMWPCELETRFEVGDVIGEGHFAEVRRCVERISNRKFALKIIDKSKCQGREHLILNEVTLLRRVKHPSIIRLYQDLHLDDRIFLVMELVNGGDLFDAIATKKRFLEHDASCMIRDMACALVYLHQMNIAHRDVKPENLLVCYYKSGRRIIKLADFGLATIVEEPLFTICGTPTYVAPEIVIQNGYGVKVDVWAVGVIAYILLCGFPPFRSTNDSQEELFDAILACDLVFPTQHWSHVTEESIAFIKRALTLDPDERFSANEMLAHTWLEEAEQQQELRHNGSSGNHNNSMRDSVSSQSLLNFSTQSEPSPKKRNNSVRRKDSKKLPWK